MDYKRILTIQDISCVGQCSLTVALPILSACGLETAILPSAVLSTHTAGFKGFTFRDLAGDMPKINEHWKNEGIKFEAIYTGKGIMDTNKKLKDVMLFNILSYMSNQLLGIGNTAASIDELYMCEATRCR